MSPRTPARTRTFEPAGRARSPPNGIADDRFDDRCTPPADASYPDDNAIAGAARAGLAPSPKNSHTSRAIDVPASSTTQPQRPSQRRVARLPPTDKGGHRIRDEDMARIGGNQQSTASRLAGARRLPLRLRDQPRRRHSTTVLVWTIFDSDVERRDETPAFLGEQKYDLAGACSDSANPR